MFDSIGLLGGSYGNHLASKLEREVQVSPRAISVRIDHGEDCLTAKRKTLSQFAVSAFARLYWLRWAIKTIIKAL